MTLCEAISVDKKNFGSKWYCLLPDVSNVSIIETFL